MGRFCLDFRGDCDPLVATTNARFVPFSSISIKVRGVLAPFSCFPSVAENSSFNRSSLRASDQASKRLRSRLSERPVAVQSQHHPVPPFASCQRAFCAREIAALPISVFGPVERPPWNLQRCFPGTTLLLQRPPTLVRAPHDGRSRKGRGVIPSSASPRAFSLRQLVPKQSLQVRCRSACRCAVAGQMRKLHSQVCSSSSRF